MVELSRAEIELLQWLCRTDKYNTQNKLDFDGPWNERSQLSLKLRLSSLDIILGKLDHAYNKVVSPDHAAANDDTPTGGGRIRQEK